MEKEKQSLLIHTIFLLLLVDPILCDSNDRLTPGQFMPSNGTLISDGGAFVLGFFSPKTTTGSSDLYLGIWYNLPQRTVIWVANRDKPIGVPSATLRFSNDGDLLVVDSEGSTSWSSNSSGNGTVALLLNTGNLVLRDDDNKVVWQSFDHPTDTLMPGMNLRFRFGDRSSTLFTSWKDADDPSPGNFTCRIDADPFLQLITRRGSEIYIRSQVWGSSLFTTSLGLGSNSVLYLTTTPTVDGLLLKLALSDSSPYTRCLEGFEPKLKRAWEGGNYSDGCSRTRALGCGEGYDFLQVTRMKLPDKFMFLRSKNMSECRSECMENCSCTAYAYNNFDVGNRTIQRCLVWMENMIDAEVYRSRGQDLYLKLMKLNSGTPGGKSNKKKIVIVVSVLAAIFSLACVFASWKFYEKTTLSDSSLSHIFQNHLSDSKEFIEGETSEAPELPLIKFESLVLATDNFSHSNKLGQGGFGIVYKGMLPGGHEIAIKRLMKGSGQGLVEFKNEVVLIAKLQHKNLVRLLGYCIHGEEQLLAYEYMPNKSLDLFLFDPTQKTKLDWGKRFNIIKGIARALMYLHQDSRLRIIHRDLKVSNILLDKDMNPKISDFGMARIFGGNQNEANTNRVVGTYGYMSPEYAMQGHFSVKSDVYSFGVLLLEIVSGMRISSFHLVTDFPNLLAYAWQLWNEGNTRDFIDPSIVHSCCPTEALRSIHVGLLCVQDDQSDRSAMSSVVFMLENESTISSKPKEPTFSTKRSINLDRDDPSAENLEICSMTITTLEGR
ncbi:putative G-type lectin S-receptor-like serine/threonine-protein kinase At1g61610 isoform X2 [Zingiber officinale]|uniref:putative G-type lectin S-receptor-like serine/threonine-protein kinase At1g61610 isoform X2 n=1 Tax=Zingiber officinale TaxID=94328 RepID=UPI001C4C9FB1|nr:putative G-type lectin S-receptor-like serine/threonine-protein kinase At1g61610 isoform X2 [Zingiber officinale]